MGYIGRIWSKILLWVGGIQYQVKGLEHLNRQRQYVFAGNHESAFDIPLAFAALPFQLVPVAKKELRKIPFFGWGMIMARHIFIDRQNHKKAMESLAKAKRSLQRNPRSLLLFPEGTRSVDGQVHQFKKGGLGLALDLGLPVVPMAVCGTAKVAGKGSWRLTPAPVELRVGLPIETKPLQGLDKKEFAERVRQEVIRLKNAWQKERTSW
jgi:1-acyl-sn-glycerol-3-phosphate acyltransferase